MWLNQTVLAIGESSQQGNTEQNRWSLCGPAIDQVGNDAERQPVSFPSAVARRTELQPAAGRMRRPKLRESVRECGKVTQGTSFRVPRGPEV